MFVWRWVWAAAVMRRSTRRPANTMAFMCFGGLVCICLPGCPPPPNLAPEADDQSVTVSFNTPTAITLTASDPDNGPQALTYSIVSPPQHGTLTGTPPSVTYTPDTGYSGPDSFTFKANDGAADSDPATVSITVQPAGAPADTDSPGATTPFTQYRGTFVITWQLQSPAGTTTGEASGMVEFGNPVDIAQLYQEYGAGTAFSVTSANSTAGIAGHNTTDANGGACAQTGGGTQANVSWGWLYILNSHEVAFELSVNGQIPVTCTDAEGQTYYTGELGAAVLYGGGGCPPEFVSLGPDLGNLEGTASYTCTPAPGITNTGTITWSLTGY